MPAVDRSVVTTFAALARGTDAAMVVVTTVASDERGGCLVGFHTAAGIDPPHYAVWLSKANHTYKVGLFAEWFAVHFLGEGDGDVAELFGTCSGNDVDKFAAVEWDAGEGGVPLLRRCPSRIVGRQAALLETTGDHVCVIVDPVDAHFDDALRPLRFTAVRHLEAGHAPEERQPP